jgi:hypothetical protein
MTIPDRRAMKTDPSEEGLIDEPDREDGPIVREALGPGHEHADNPRPGGAGGVGPQAGRPARNDPRHADQSVLPGQDDLPAGSERRKPSGSS